MHERTITNTSGIKEPKPHVITKDQHKFSNNDIDRDALKVLKHLHTEGHKAYLVGGGVRDLYLKRIPKDYDISTDARPGQIRRVFRNSRTICRRFRLVQVFFPENKIIEVSTFRCKSEYDIAGEVDVLPANNTFGTEADDAFRRDLTINSLFYDIENEAIIDYTGGVDDLKNGIIRLIGNPDKRIIRDPVRILRSIRHASRIKFSIEEQTWNAIVSHREKLRLCPVSRIRDEILKDFRGGANFEWLQLMISSGVFYILFPFYRDVFDDEGAKYKELLANILGVIERIQKNHVQLSETFLLALFLIPWSYSVFPEMSVQMKNGQIYSLSRRIKTALDSSLEHLNIKKASKEHIASLLARLNVFAVHDKNGNWPGWLKKKSYFKENSYFYIIYREATGGTAVDLADLPCPVKKNRFLKTGSRRNERNPAFAKGKKKGGVFGLRRKH